ncbi:D-alanyl-D-alanine carboxypeptidase [Aquiflexum sp. TKW24L]|uniref:D-alanyl-D-alanine carboxypeptidase n=1 Tax=Aquiflexum sp. TKW24L TaxID=2942212 RepID=UPI0020BFA9C4|nr:D-alanyl-D-alanine carboxypeptidase [Aquiflexum sp. TKW24L]MCL6260993.1 D-alanyl-D-alanine carboxypeptidase [Aquiflexum sp. TKW24L]
MKKSIFVLTLSVLFSVQITEAQKLNSRKVRKMFEQSDIMQEHFVGFMLQEEGGKIIYEQNHDRYFVPASNTKLLTLYAALNILGDSIPGLKYHINGDSLIVWGTGDPSFLHPKLDNRKVFDFLSKSPHTIYFAKDPDIEFEPSAWRADLSHFPMYGNETIIKSDSSSKLKVSPPPILNYIKVDSSFVTNRFGFRRSKMGTELLMPNLPIPIGFDSQIPFPMDMEVTRVLLQDTLKKNITLIKKQKPIGVKTLYSIPSDSLYKHLMLPSDNFLAEQILLICSGVVGDTLAINKTIEYSLENHLKDLKHKPIWEDGSGLSRFNLFTPGTVLEVLNKLEQKIQDKERLKLLLPAGGVSGTLKNAYKTDNGIPFVWAKTGSLRYMHLQSGWLETRKGRTYRYVFMNNNFVRPTSEIRNEMVMLMTEIHEKY